LLTFNTSVTSVTFPLHVSVKILCDIVITLTLTYFLMESTPISSKRNRDLISPESDCEYKRVCSSSALNPDSDSFDSSGALHSDMSSIEATTCTPDGNPSPFIDQLLDALRSKDVLSLIGAAVAEAIKPTLQQEMATLVAQNRQLEGDVEILKHRLSERDLAMEELAIKLDRSEQYTRRNNLRIMGIPETQGEDTDKLIVNVAKDMGVDLSTTEIDISHRVPRYPSTPQTKARPIIVMFVSNASRRSLLANRSKLKAVGKKSAPKIFVNEDLTKTRAIIARKARGLVSEGRIESSWVTGGVILIKKKDGTVNKVSNVAQYDEICDSIRLKMRFNLSQQPMVGEDA